MELCILEKKSGFVWAMFLGFYVCSLGVTLMSNIWSSSLRSFLNCAQPCFVEWNLEKSIKMVSDITHCASRWFLKYCVFYWINCNLQDLQSIEIEAMVTAALDQQEIPLRKNLHVEMNSTHQWVPHLLPWC